MAGVFNAFDFGISSDPDGPVWDTDPSTSQDTANNDGGLESSTDPEINFVTLFGVTASSFDGPGFSDPALLSGALFGEHPDSPSIGYNITRVLDDYTSFVNSGTRSNGLADILQESPVYTADYSSPNLGVALIRPVPIPAAAWLFGSALGGLTVLRRKCR